MNDTAIVVAGICGAFIMFCTAMIIVFVVAKR